MFTTGSKLFLAATTLSIIAVENAQIICGNLPQAVNGLLANAAVFVD